MSTILPPPGDILRSVEVGACRRKTSGRFSPLAAGPANTPKSPGALRPSTAGEYLAGPDGGVELTVGLVNLCGWLLLRPAKAEGTSGNATPDEQRAILRDIALRSWRRSGGEGLADGGGSVQH
jgi:hypothetical protein